MIASPLRSCRIQALLGGKLLKPQSLAMMTEAGRLKDGRLSSLGRTGDRPSQSPLRNMASGS